MLRIMKNQIRKLLLCIEFLKYILMKNTKESNYIKILKKTYKKKINRQLNFDAPVYYTEKIQIIKLDSKNREIMSSLTDKLKVRQWIKDTIGEKHLVPLLGVYKKFSDINFDLLPNSFVIKTNHGSGTNIIVPDKEKLDLTRAKTLVDHWMRLNYAYMGGLELQYKDINPFIIIEYYLGPDSKLFDYKFLCFNGEPHYFWIDVDRQTNHKRNVYDMNWNLQNWNQRDYGNYTGAIEKPSNFSEMVEIATKLSKGFVHVRIDLYSVNDKVFFGEMTFTNGSGFEKIIPDIYDKYLGDLM